MKIVKSSPTPYDAVQMETARTGANGSIDHIVKDIQQRAKMNGERFFLCLYVVSGNMSLTDCAEEVIAAGNGFLISGEAQMPKIVAQNCTFRILCIWNELFIKSCDYLSESLYKEIAAGNSPMFFSMPIENVFFFENLFDKFLNSEAEDQIILSRGIVAMLVSLVTHPKGTNYEQYPSIIKKILSILNSMPKIMEGIPQEIYDLGYSKNYICRIFRKYMGMTITNYITDRKLKHSIMLFNSTHASVSEVCEALNIESVPYFTKIFKQKFGITPAKYRNNISLSEKPFEKE